MGKPFYKCLAVGCPRSTDNSPDLKFVRVPEMKARKTAWLKTLGRDDLVTHENLGINRVCAMHFAPDMWSSCGRLLPRSFPEALSIENQTVPEQKIRKLHVEHDAGNGKGEEHVDIEKFLEVDLTEESSHTAEKTENKKDTPITTINKIPSKQLLSTVCAVEQINLKTKKSIKPGRGASSQTKEIVVKFYNYFLKETGRISSALDRITKVTALHPATIYRYVNEGKRNLGEGTSRQFFTSPKKKIPHKKWVTHIDEITLSAIRQKIHQFRLTEGYNVTIKDLRQKLIEDGLFEGSKESLRIIIKQIGFKWKKTEDNRKLLIEKVNLQYIRIQYLREIRKYREEGRYIVYLHETYLHFSESKSNELIDNSNEGFRNLTHKGPRLIIAHAGGENGFIKDGLLIFNSGTQSGEYHDEMNGVNFRLWMTNHLIPNLPMNSVVVMDNAPYLNARDEHLPKSTWKKKDIQSWLTSKAIAFSEELFKPELLRIVFDHKKNFEMYQVDKILERAGHAALRLPPYHPELNSIKQIWTNIKDKTCTRNTTSKLNDVQKILQEEFNNITTEEWNTTCEITKKVEKKFWENEIKFDSLSDEFSLVTNAGESSCEDEDSLSTSEDDF